MSAKNVDRHNRFRSITVGFRVSPEENEQLNRAVALSGLPKQEYCYQKCMNRDITVTPNPRIFKMMNIHMKDILIELQRLCQGDNPSQELLEDIALITKMLNDITSDGIMVYCQANELYLRLTAEDQLGIDESILSRFRDDERNTVIQIMKAVTDAGSINNAETRVLTGKSKPTVTRLLAKMRNYGLLISEGSGPAIRYRKSDQLS